MTPRAGSLKANQNANSIPELCIVLPTFNEAQNVAPILERLSLTLQNIDYEVIFVDDDSTDGTRTAVAREAKRHANVRLISRLSRRGLSTAVVEGALSSFAPFIAVMDADMQHDEALLPKMLETLRNDMSDLVIGTRYIEGGGVGEWGLLRQRISTFSTMLAKSVMQVNVSDPMSGFFMITRASFDESVRNLSGQGFKILLDIISSSPKPMRIVELPYVFRERLMGESKLDSAVAMDYLTLLIDKTIGRFVPTRFLMFAAVGGVGLVVHLAVLATLMSLQTEPDNAANFIRAQAIATTIAMTFNFFVNNFLTYKDRRLRGVRKIFFGLLSFYLICGLGAIANVGIAGYMFTSEYAWWLAGIAGVLIGAVWNYAVTSVFTWNSN